MRPALYSLLLLFSLGCTSLFYYPTNFYYADPEKYGLDSQYYFFEQGDGFKLAGWLLTAKKNESKVAPKKRGLIVFFHGNAQNMTAHFVNLFWLPPEGYDIFIFDYRGYGISEGSPNPRGVYLDGLAALNFAYEIKQKEKYPKFIVYGQSLGGAIAMRALEDFKPQEKIDLVVLDSTFNDYQKLAADKLQKAGVFSLLKPLTYVILDNSYAALKFPSSNTRPTLSIHGTHDLVVPYEVGDHLYHDLKTNQKWFWKIEKGRHTNVFFTENLKYRAQFIDFLGHDIR